MSPSAPPSTSAGPSRTPVQFDARTGGLRIGPYERHVEDPRQPEQVYGAYLSLLYAVRRAQPGERLALRSADLEALLLLVGDDPQTIESRLVALMGCTPAEAGALSRLLLRQRRATATLGIAAGLSLAGMGLATQLTGSEQAVAPVAAQQRSSATQAPVEQPVQAPAPVAPVVVAPVVVGPTAAAPVAPVRTAPVAPAALRAVVGPEATAPVIVAPAPVLVAPAVAAAPAVEPEPAAPAVAVAPAPAAQPVEVAPEDRYTPPLVEEPVWDAPPPPVEAPESAIGEAISLEPEPIEPGPLEPISGVTDSEHAAPLEPISGVTDSGHDVPVEAPATTPPTAEDVAVAEPAAEGTVPPAVPDAEQVPTDSQA